MTCSAILKVCYPNLLKKMYVSDEAIKQRFRTLNHAPCSITEEEEEFYTDHKSWAQWWCPLSMLLKESGSLTYESPPQKFMTKSKIFCLGNLNNEKPRRDLGLVGLVRRLCLLAIQSHHMAPAARRGEDGDRAGHSHRSLF